MGVLDTNLYLPLFGTQCCSFASYLYHLYYTRLRRICNRLDAIL
nr:MAG TPA: hypothetical protein [Caudoviricetes sp.]